MTERDSTGDTPQLASHDDGCTNLLEALLEDTTLSVEEQDRILSRIAGLHRRRGVAALVDLLSIPDIHPDNNELWTHLPRIVELANSTLPCRKDDLADMFLDWAISSKRAREAEMCVFAHLCRMAFCSRYETIDAVRLLGISCPSMKTGDFTVQELPTDGIFGRDSSLSDDRCYRGSERAYTLGKALQTLFEKTSYTLQKCRTYLVSLIEEEIGLARIFDATCFFRNRHKLIDITEGDPKFIVVSDVLVRLFLFGVAVSKWIVRVVLGEENVTLLLRSGLLEVSVANTDNFVGAVQIYPISASDLYARNISCCLFMTDWPMESIRSTQHAVMSVGYDTLELMSLTATGSPSCSGSNETKGRLLDLCCGCGIQGIFALKCANESTTAFDQLVCSDINRRACCFAAANAALNQLEQNVVCVVEGDLYERVKGKFNCIISNPPFVAVPSYDTGSAISRALYAVGGGSDGTELLSRLVQRSLNHLDSNGSLLIVTEVPNVESSCSQLHRFMLGEPADIRVAYVDSDVETVEQYAAIRRKEADPNVEGRDDGSPQIHEGIHNRALALIAISHGETRSLYRYDDNQSTAGCIEDVDSTYEEDAFLTEQGVAFTRSRLL